MIIEKALSCIYQLKILISILVYIRKTNITVTQREKYILYRSQALNLWLVSFLLNYSNLIKWHKKNVRPISLFSPWHWAFGDILNQFWQPKLFLWFQISIKFVQRILCVVTIFTWYSLTVIVNLYWFYINSLKNAYTNHVLPIFMLCTFHYENIC